jgi:hypothetical protein
MEMKLAIDYVRHRPEVGAACGSSGRRMENPGMSVTNAARQYPFCIETGRHILSSYLMEEDGQRSQTDEPEQNASKPMEASNGWEKTTRKWRGYRIPAQE